MTLICALPVVDEGCVIVLGDSLLSSSKMEEFRPPLTDNLAEECFDQLQRKPIGLTQKVFPVGDRTVLGWSGNLIQAIQLEKRVRNDKEKFDKAELFEKCVRKYEKYYRGIEGFIIHRSKESGNIYIKCINTEQFDYGTLRGMVLCGTGAGEYLKLLEDSPDRVHLIREPKKEYSNTELFILMHAQIFIRFMLSQNISGAGLEKAVGGAFALMAIGGEGIIKLDRYVIRIWGSSEESNNGLPLNCFGMAHVRYYDSNIAITSFENIFASEYICSTPRDVFKKVNKEVDVWSPNVTFDVILDKFEGRSSAAILMNTYADGGDKREKIFFDGTEAGFDLEEEKIRQIESDYACFREKKLDQGKFDPFIF